MKWVCMKGGKEKFGCDEVAYLGVPMGRTCRDQPRRWWKQEEEQSLLFSWGSEPLVPHLWGRIENPVGVVGAEITEILKMMNPCCTRSMMIKSLQPSPSILMHTILCTTFCAWLFSVDSLVSLLYLSSYYGWMKIRHYDWIISIEIKLRGGKDDRMTRIWILWDRVGLGEINVLNGCPWFATRGNQGRTVQHV